MPIDRSLSEKHSKIKAVRCVRACTIRKIMHADVRGLSGSDRKLRTPRDFLLRESNARFTFGRVHCVQYIESRRMDGIMYRFDRKQARLELVRIKIFVSSVQQIEDVDSMFVFC